MTTYRWAILGLGGMANEFATQFDPALGTLVAAGSRSLDKATAFCQTHSIPKPHGSYHDLFLDPEVDIIYIATPHNHHFSAIQSALTHGKHVLCEKAITLNAKELSEMMTLAEEKKLILAEAMTIYHMPLYQELKKRIVAKEFGHLKTIQASFGSFKESNPKNRFFNPDLAGGALLDIGTYALAFVRYFLTSHPTDINSLMTPFSTKVDEQSVTILKNSQNELATVALTFQAKMPKQGIIALEKAFITVTDYPRATTAIITYLDGRTESLTVGKTELALNYEVENMTHYVNKTKKNQTLALSYDVMTILDAMKKQW